MSTTAAVRPGAECPDQYMLVCEITMSGRGTPLGEVLSGVRVADQDGVVAAGDRTVQSRTNAFVGLGAGDDESADSARSQLRLEVGVLERVAVPLVDDRFRPVLLELLDVLPLLATYRQVVGGVLDPDHGDVRRPCLVDDIPDVADHLVALDEFRRLRPSARR